jgi:predicted nucleic acid-binding Zn ribbon protein
MRPDAADLTSSGPASGRRVPPGAVTSRASAQPGFAPQPRRVDPVPLSSAISGLLDAQGWALAAATGSVFGRWAEIVGGDLAGHTRPERLADGELTVVADSTAWATQVRLLAAQLVLRLNTELGDGTVLRVKVRGPALPDRKPGQWRVRGSRGPRDTYG